MFENVKMKKEFLDYINNLFGVEPICINSALVSAQNRVRYYWTNIDGVEQPEDKEVTLHEILEDNASKVGAIRGRYIVNGKRADNSLSNLKGVTEQRLEIRGDNKTNTITTVQKDNVVIDPKYYLSERMLAGFANSKSVFKDRFKPHNEHTAKSYCLTARYYKMGKTDPYVADNVGIRRLTPRECFRLQTVPEHHIDTLLNSGISNSQLYKMAGNGWTHDVITHIFKGLI